MSILNSNIVTYDGVVTNESFMKLVEEIFNKPEEPTIHTLRVGPYIISGTDYAQVIKKFVEICKEKEINKD